MADVHQSYSVATVNASGTLVADDIHSVSTSTFPYDSIGPIDFSRLNFVKTCETDYYYSATIPNATTPPLLVSEVTQCYNPTQAFWTITGVTFLVLALISGVVWFIAKRSRGVDELFPNL